MDFPELASALKALLKGSRFDVVQLEYTAMAQYARVVRTCSPHTAVVLDEIDVSYLALERRLNLVDEREQADLRRQVLRMKQYERARWGEFDAVVTMSEEERLEVASVESSRARVVPNGVDTRYFSFRERQEGPHPRVLFFGSLLHPPNRHGLQRFFAEIWPKLIEQNSLAKLEVVGEGASTELMGYDSGTVNFHGFVPDLRPFLAEASLLVVPIWTGAGTRLKVLEAFASGLPVVSTRLGCEGLGAEPGKHFLPAETPGEFIKRIGELTSDPDLGRAISTKARLLVEKSYDWEVVTRRAEAVWEEVARRPSAQRH